jgi:acyl carrier protein
MHKTQIREILLVHGRLSVHVESLADESDLYDAGLTSLMTVNLLLALEDHFDIEFPDRMLSRRTFQSINALSDAISEILSLREQ